MHRTIYITLILSAISFMLYIIWNTQASFVEKPKYTVLKSHDSIEIREYDPIILAQTNAMGDRNEAIKVGFKRLLNYITGDNSSNTHIQMTAPVLQTAVLEKRTLSKRKHRQWKISFIMPIKYNIKMLPTPHNTNIKILEQSKAQWAVIRFSGFASKNKLADYQKRLEAYLIKHSMTPIQQEPSYAFYNPPWTLPFLRRNEIMFQIQ